MAAASPSEEKEGGLSAFNEKGKEAEVYYSSRQATRKVAHIMSA